MKANVGDKIFHRRYNLNAVVISIRKSRVAPYYVEVTRTGYSNGFMCPKGDRLYVSGRDFDVIEKANK